MYNQLIILRNKKKKKCIYNNNNNNYNQAKIPSVMMSSKYEESRSFEWIFISVAVICALLVSAAAFIIMKRHSKFKSKFEGLIGSNTEVSKDYQVHTFY